MQQLTLYYKTTCASCRKVLYFLEQNDIAVTLKNTLSDVQTRDELVQIGGKMQVPCLVINGQALYESEKIIQWFKDNYIRQ